MNFIGDWDARTTNLVAISLLLTAFVLLIILCVLAVFFCRKSRIQWTERSILSKFDNSPDSSCMNDGFDISDETAPRRIEQRRNERQRALFCEDTVADVPARYCSQNLGQIFGRFDRSMGKALAVEKLLRDSYVFDTNILPRPEGDVQIIAAKRDYL